MSAVLEGIDEKLAAWLCAQPMFFVASAPLAGDGHVNVSPKGMDGTFAVLDCDRVAYLDYFGSGVETIAHLRENGRIVLMFCAFTGRPQIVRLHGRGHAVRPGDQRFTGLRANFRKERDHGVRSIIVIDVDRVSDSCGYSVPQLEFVSDRTVLDLHQLNKPADYYADEAGAHRNGASIDGLPALERPVAPVANRPG